MKTQIELIQLLKGNKLFHAKKFGEFRFRRAQRHETLETWVDGKLETTKEVEPGDYIMTGPTGEEFALSAESFTKRYRIITELFPDNNRGIATAIGEVWCMVSAEGFEFESPWGDPMICESGDYLCSPNSEITEVYRIEKKIFNTTYKIIE